LADRLLADLAAVVCALQSEKRACFIMLVLIINRWLSDTLHRKGFVRGTPFCLCKLFHALGTFARKKYCKLKLFVLNMPAFSRSSITHFQK